MIHSKVSPEILLHVVFVRGDMTSQRKDIVAAEEGLQVAAFTLGEGQTFKPHVHLKRPRVIHRTQETWIIISGRVLVRYYDIDDTIIGERELQAGDCTITLGGGHNYVGLTEKSEVYEVKTGPFIGAEKDKRLLK